MIRLTFLYFFLAAIFVTAIRHWYAALCGLVMLTVLTQHPSMPTNMFGVQGLNPWNAALLVVGLSWLINRRFDPPAAPAPGRISLSFYAFVFLVVATGLVAAFDHGSVQGMAARQLNFTGMVVNTIINPLKFLAVGLLFYDGARTRQRVSMAMFVGVSSGVVYALLLFKSMKTRVFTINFEDARRMTDKLVGLFANDLAELFAFTLWAGLFLYVIIAKRWQRGIWYLALAAVVPPFLALKSRAGFLACCMVGMVLGALRWRRILVLLPAAAAVVAVAVPSVRERVLTGVTVEEQEESWDEISAGRMTNVWPPVLDQIAQSPIIGHGRMAILRESCFEEILARERYVPMHPHCSYLEILLDAGVLGLAIGLVCALGLFRVGWSLVRQRQDALLTGLGAMAVAAVVAELTAGLTGSSFYPSQSSVPYLCIWGAALRVYAESTARRSGGMRPFVMVR